MALDVTISTVLLVWIVIWGETVARECSDTWILGAALDTVASKFNNATVSFTRIYLAKNTTQCSNDCCQQIHGLCDLAVFTETSTKRTCYHYRCFPIEQCRFKRDNESEFYLVSISATENQSLSYLDEVTTPPVIVESARGDGTRSKPRKGAQPDEVRLDHDVPLKRDNDTVVPRKGVLPVANPDIIDDVNDTRHSLQSVMEGQDNGVIIPQDKDIVNSNLTDNSSSKLQLESNSTQDVALSTTNVSQVLPTVTETIVEFHTGQTIVTLGSQEPLGPQVPKGPQIPKDPQDPLSDQEQFTGNGTVVEDYEGSEKEEVVVVRTSYSEIAFGNSGSMRLVIGLVLGLLVLLGVFGLVGKRIHDSWLRRHYRRMDFLVDGMYHGNP